MTDAFAAVRAWASSHELAVDVASDDALSITIPGAQRLRIPIAFTKTPQALIIECFVLRATDEDPRALYEFILQRNTRAFGVAYSIDANRDVFLVGRLPLAAISVDTIDQSVGNVLSMADGDFNTLLELAYPEAIAREWRWRLSHGESVDNLAAFPHLRPSDI